MGELFWTPHFDDLQDAAAVLNDLEWHLRWKELDGRWYLWAGVSKLFIGDTQGELQAFIWGMAVSWTALPDACIEEIKRIIDTL
jgi:hypothetical protein